MVGWHHQLDGVLGDGEGQGGLVCCSPWGCRESDNNGATEQQQHDGTLCIVMRSSLNAILNEPTVVGYFDFVGTSPCQD